MTQAISLGTYKLGEVPLDVTYTFLESTGTAINLTGYTAKLEVTSPSNTVAYYNATVTTPASGLVTAPWDAAMTATAGQWTIRIWCNVGGTKLVSATLVYNVATAASPTF